MLFVPVKNVAMFFVQMWNLRLVFRAHRGCEKDREKRDTCGQLSRFLDMFFLNKQNATSYCSNKKQQG